MPDNNCSAVEIPQSSLELAIGDDPAGILSLGKIFDL
jgi:hypothetical protein